jgi:hypothetical protein
MATSARRQSYTNMVAATAITRVPSSSQASPPHEKNSDSVSMSPVTRATSAPRRCSAWSASDREWRCRKASVRSPYSASSLRRARRTTAHRLATVATSTTTTPTMASWNTIPRSTPVSV